MFSRWRRAAKASGRSRQRAASGARMRGPPSRKQGAEGHRRAARERARARPGHADIAPDRRDATHAHSHTNRVGFAQSSDIGH
ncbi:protein of unknown function [Burkholderia multivorans]